MPESTASNESLPTFRKPPVVETVLGLQFDPISGMTNAHLGAFWRRLAGENVGDWNQTTDAPALAPVFEQFEDEQSWYGHELRLRLTQDPACRVQIRNASGDAMIQVQNGRFHYNWIGSGGENYPRYSVVRPDFDRLYGAFCTFLAEAPLASPRVNQWEVTYVNHIPRGTVWDTPDDWSRLFVGLHGISAKTTAVALESLNGSWHFRAAGRPARLHIDLKHARLPEAKTGSDEVLTLTLTARGTVSDAMQFSDGLSLGRELIVLTFRDITSPEAHEYWELEA